LTLPRCKTYNPCQLNKIAMPTYEYACAKCGHEFEFFQSMKDQPLTNCPKEKCKLKKWGKGRVKKLMGAGAGLIFKGSGFYITDYRSEGYKQAAKKESGGGEKPAGGGEKASGGESKKAETKPAAPAKKAGGSSKSD
jgi:putative FmdB family regulatory protein